VFEKTPGEAQMGPWFKYDPEEAKKMLAAAGSEDLEFELKYNAPSSGPVNPEAQHSAVAEFFRAVGVTMTLNNMENQAWNSYFNGREFVKEPGEAVLGYVTGPPTASGFYHRAVHSQSPGNVTAVNDPQIDQWAEQQRVELDPAARKELLRNIWDRMLTEMYHINAASTYFVTGFQPWVRYWRANGPLLTMYSTSTFGYGYHKGWLDK
jgi:ABC-type transport system substrate-binding protein